MTNNDEKMTDRIVVQITPSMKEKYNIKCKQGAINPSDLVRKWIEEFIEGSE